MGVHTTKSTIPGGITPICNDCGVSLCWDIDLEEYNQYKVFWDNWSCRDCNPDNKGSYKKFKQEIN